MTSNVKKGETAANYLKSLLLAVKKIVTPISTLRKHTHFTAQENRRGLLYTSRLL